jgi:hypothetical protein
MKRAISSFLSILIALFAQGQDIDPITLSKLRLNFVVPDMPAFKTLNTEPSNLLRPSTPKEFALSFSQFYQDKKFLLPEAFAVEISPALLLNANKRLVDLKRYAKRAVANSFRISLGTSTDSVLNSPSRNLGVGFRISLINKGDLTIDTLFHRRLSTLLEKFRQDVRKVSLIQFAQMKSIDMTQLDWEDLIFSDAAMKAEFDAYLANENESSQRSFLAALKKLKEEYRRDNWNATKLDVAVAILSTSSDSLLKNIQFNRADVWITAGLKVGKSGQLLLGANAQTVTNLADTGKTSPNRNYSNISIPVRYLLGTNRIKGFVEAQYSYRGEFEHHKFLFNLGAEFNIVDGVWANLSGGFDENTTLNFSSFIANFSLKLTLPEEFKLF